jgi:wyosine [tRNA(Phe)-imidazoG37] synthetase (radical SAM superfamily)
MPKSTVYGPVASWRLGRSLGIDMLCTEQKTCNFDCIYCQLGPTAKLQTERQEFVPMTKLSDDLNAARGVAADWVTFSGMGEPTLAANLGAAITLVKSTLGLPVAVLTNGSLIKREDVRGELSLADMVIVKMDVPDEAGFRAINRPAEGIALSGILQGLQLFRMEYKGKLILDMMLTELNKGNLYNLQMNARFAMPDQVQLNTPLRPCAIKPLPAAELENLRKSWFYGQNTVTVYEAKRPEVTPVDAEETEQRHPTKPRISPVASQTTASCQQTCSCTSG